MYLSPVIAEIIDDPIEDESIEILVRVPPDSDSNTKTGVESYVEEMDGSIEAELEFSTLQVALPQQAIEGLAEINGIESIETTGVLDIDLNGAGEDVIIPDASGDESGG